MDDRALLEAAARAAGIEVVSQGDDFWIAEDGIPIKHWSPLRDDGDEARLESILELDVVWGGTYVIVGCTTELLGNHEIDDQTARQAARRRAGVRAAAAIGRAS